MNQRELAFRILVSVCLSGLLAACAGGFTPSDEQNGSSPPSQAAVAGAASNVPPPSAGAPSTAGTLAAAGTGGVASVVAGTGGAGGMSSSIAGTGGAAGMAGAAGTPGAAGAQAAGACLCRGEAPTETTATADGPYVVDSYTDGLAAPAGVSSFTVFYPTDAEPPFAGVAVVPGFASPESSIRTWGPFLASHGIVTVTIGVPGGDQPNVRAEKLMGTITSLKAENARAGSPLVGKIDVKVPVLMFEATADPLASGMSDGYSSDVPDTVPQMLFEVQGSSHNVANSPGNHDGVIGRYGLSWMKVFLEQDERYRQFLTAPFPSVCTSKCAHNLQ